MQFYKVLRGPISIATGTVAMDPAQARRRRFQLEATETPGRYTVTGRVQFKTGEVFGWDGDAHRAIVGASHFGDVIEVIAPPAHLADVGEADSDAAGEVTAGEVTAAEFTFSGVRPDSAEGRAAEVMVACEHGLVTGKLDEGDKTQFTAAGSPHVEALEQILGWKPSAAERDAGWNAYRAVAATEAEAENAEDGAGVAPAA